LISTKSGEKPKPLIERPTPVPQTNSANISVVRLEYKGQPMKAIVYIRFMAFNHYAKIKRILEAHSQWYIVRIDEPTTAKSFKGEVKHFDHYYRVYDAADQPIPYCKFQQLDLFANTMNIPEDLLSIRQV